MGPGQVRGVASSPRTNQQSNSPTIAEVGLKVPTWLPYIAWVFFCFIALFYAVEILIGGNSWKTADWLINFSAGPVRRGLIGTLLIAIADLGIPLLWLVYALQVAVYGWIFYLVLKIFTIRERSVLWLAILFSPAFLLFPFYDLAGGFRKEVLVFAAFALLSLAYVKRNITVAVLVTVTVLYALAVFSHESTVFVLPYFLYLTYHAIRQRLVTLGTAVAFGLTLSVAAGTATMFAMTYQGNAALAARLCDGLISRGYNEQLCQGAIEWLGHGAYYHVDMVERLIPSYVQNYPILFALALLPLFLTTWINRETLTLMLVALLGTTPLFVLAIDWGRWIHIHIFFLFCLALSSQAVQKIYGHRVAVLASVLYLTTWSVPSCCTNRLGDGFIMKAYKYATIVWPSWRGALKEYLDAQGRSY